MNSYYQTDLSGFNFEYLRGTRFQSVYDILNVAKDLNEVDKGSCCTKLRYALEIVISEVIAICDLKSYKRKNINGNIELIKSRIPRQLRDYNGEDIVIEMHNVRLHGNDGTHYDDSSDVDVDKAAHTCWIGMRKICRWVSRLEPLYAKYIEEERIRREREAEALRIRKEQAAEEARKRRVREAEEERIRKELAAEEARKRNEERKATAIKCLKFVGKVALAAVGVLVLDKMRKK